MKYGNLFSPLRIAEPELPNHIIFPPISTNYTKDGFVTDRLIDFYAERARGGTGLIIVEDTMVEDHADVLPALREAIGQVRSGSPIVLDINLEPA